LACRDHGQGVPVIGSSDQDDIEISFLKHVAVVVVGPGLLVRRLALSGNIRRISQHPLVHVAQGYDLYRSHLDEPPEVAFAIPPRTNQSHAILLILEFFSVYARGCKCKAGRGLKKSSSVHVGPPENDGWSNTSRIGSIPPSPNDPATQPGLFMN